MELNSKLIQAVSDDVAYVQDFKNSFTQRYSHISLDECSQEIKQLVESVALLMAKNRISGENAVASLYQRLFGQIYPFLASPLPALGLIKFDGYQIYEPTDIAPGTMIVVSSEDNQQALFRTQCSHTIYPVKISNLSLKREGLVGSKFEIELQNTTSVPGALKELNFYINAGEDWGENLKFKNAVSDPETRIFLELSNGKRYECRVSFGKAQGDNVNPLYEMRQYFQMPQLHSFMKVEFDQAPEEWSDGRVIILMEAEWPKNVRLSKDLLQLNVVPAENSQYEDSEIILVDGTKSQHPILAPNASDELELYKVEGIFKLNGSDRIAVNPSFVSEDIETYDLSTNTENGLYEINLRMPNAFDTPEQVVAEALWHSPQFSNHLWKPLKARFYDRDISGVSSRVLPNVRNPISPYQPMTELTAEQNIMLSAIKNKVRLELQDLLLLLDSLGSVWKGEYKPVRILLDSLRDVDQDFTDSSGRVKSGIHYILGFKSIEEYLRPLVLDFLDQVERILQDWVIDLPVKLSGDFCVVGRHDLDHKIVT
ncbi:type VI secretion system baseplate subunit TssF [Microbulbifer sp. TRSA001]|uniref:type VI secretion system baseplate subunit TssF n=1 Tax=Microbulbifer sp. TRSA001 TaxID=3243381 RepID=UPI004039A98B